MLKPAKMPTMLSIPVAFALVTACSTIPKGAPEEFSHAEKEIKEAKKENVANIMPKTLSTAESKLSQASDEWRKHDDAKSREAATAMAWTAGKLAEDARKATEKVHNWDKDIDTFTAETSLKRETPVAVAEVTRAEVLTFNKPIAYFNIGSARLSAEGRKAVKELAETLRKDPELQVVLTGRADAAGPRGLNEHLCLRRAESVRKELEAHGIKAGQIKVEPVGPGMIARHMMGPGHMQLQRRVDIEVKSSVAH
ncbi:OmpA family protein [bacterium]|nr:OmpA family protein [bacterium]